MNAQGSNEENGVPLRPLTGGRYRTHEVEAQIRWIQSMAFTEASRRIAERDASGVPLIKEEALVYLLRDYQRRGCAREAGKVAQTLLERSAPRIARWVQRGLPGAAAVHCEQCIEEIQNQMWIALQSDSAGCEFWEIAFWMCLKRRTMNCLDQSRKVAFVEVHPTLISEESDQETSLMDLMPDRSIEDLQARIEMQEALNRLPADQRQALHLFYREQWSQQQIAEQFGVADRTIRNWLTAALKSLRSYYGVAT
jgi:RNA polymerase sigma factor (sigma-70 family)